MGDEDENKTVTPDRSARDSWLNSILGPMGHAPKAPTQANQGAPSASLPHEFKHQLLFKSDFRPPADSKLTGVEVREVPDQVYAVSGEMTQDGTWKFVCEHLDSVSFYADDIEDLRHSTAVVAKFLLTRDGDQRTWSEVEASQLILVENAVDEVTVEKNAPSEDTSPESLTPGNTSNRDSCIATMIEIDVSVDSDGQDNQAQRSVLISGLAPAAILTAGQKDEAGMWTVQQTDLKNLAIIVPEGTPPFDIDIALDEDEAAVSIQVEAPESIVPDSENTLLLRLSPSSELAPHRIRIFSDGREIYDRVMLWGDDPDIPLDIMIGMPALDDLPFELLIREESLDKDQPQTANLLAAELNDHPVRLDDNLMRGNMTQTANGWAWHGDLIFSVRESLTARDPDEPANDEPIKDAPDITDVVDQHKDQSATPDSTSDGDVLVIQASTSDIERSGFIAELNALQSFVRGRADPNTEEVYDRLSLKVRNLCDVQVIGPTGAEVELSPAWPNLSPLGGRDNVVQTISITERGYAFERYDSIEFRGLPAGCLLSRGRNLGQGRWRVASCDIGHTSIIGLATFCSASIAQMFGASNEQNDKYATEHMLADVLIGGASRRVTPSNDQSSIITVPLDAQTFSPDGHATLSLTIGDVPAGVLLTHGANHGDGVWTYETTVGDQLGFQILVPHPAFSVSITCVAMSNDSADSTIITHRARIRPDRMEVALDQAVNA
jgi:hypothetical protein